MENTEPKRTRRSKTELEGRNFFCECGKTYFSQQALFVHKKTKHSDSLAPDELVMKKRGRPRINKEYKSEEDGDYAVSSGAVAGKLKSCIKKRKRETCDEIFSEFLEEKEGRIRKEEFFEVKKSIFSLRQCINTYSEKVDSEDFLRHDDYTLTEKPELIPNIFEFYIEEYLPQNCLGLDRKSEFARVYEFFQWLKMKNYTEIEVAQNEELHCD